MKDLSNIRVPLIVGALLVGGFAMNGGFDLGKPSEPSVNGVKFDPTGPDMMPVFSQNTDKKEAKAHAADFAAICRKAATTIRFDAQRGDKKRLNTGLDLATYRVDLLEYTTDGWRPSQKYPGIKNVVAAHLDARAGTSPKAMDDPTREKWAQALDSLANNSQYAAEALK